jgi:hypothetical protein
MTALGPPARMMGSRDHQVAVIRAVGVHSHNARSGSVLHLEINQRLPKSNLRSISTYQILII